MSNVFSPLWNSCVLYHRIRLTADTFARIFSVAMSHRRQAIFTLALNLTVCPSHGITLIWRDVTSDILIRVNYIRVSLEAFVSNKRRSGIRENDGRLNSGSKRTNPNIPYAAYSVGCFRLCNCDNILLPQPPPWYRRVLFPRGSSAWACNEPSWTKLSRRRASCRLPHICLYTCRHMWTVRVMHASPTEYVSPLNNVLAGYVSGGCRPSFARHPLQYGECWILDAISIELRGSDGEAFKLFLTNYHRTIFEFLKLLRRMWRWLRDVRWLLFEIFLKWKQDF